MLKGQREAASRKDLGGFTQAVTKLPEQRKRKKNLWSGDRHMRGRRCFKKSQPNKLRAKVVTAPQGEGRTV